MQRVLTTIGIAALLAACSGGGGGGDSTETTGVSFGAITGFGSVVTNDRRYNTDNASFFKDGEASSQSELALGMMIRIEGDVENGVANRVSYDENVKGPVDSVGADSLVVMGQTVLTDAGTNIRQSGPGGGPIALSDITAGEIVEVSGSRVANDELLATFIERKTSVNKYKVIGSARNVNAGAMTLEIGDLLVRWGTVPAEIDDDFAGGLPSEGQLIEVKDENLAYAFNSLVLDATKIEPHDELQGAGAGARIEVQGVVTDATNAPASFVLSGGQVVHTSLVTSYRFGTAADIALGSALQVEGQRRDDGGVDALKIKFRKNAVRVTAFVNAVDPDPAARTVTLLDSQVVVKVPSDDVMEDDRDNLQPFGLNDLAQNDYVEIRGFIGANGVLVATQLERDNDDTDVRLRAVATAKSLDPDTGVITLTLLGVTVSSSGTTQFEGDDDDTPLTAQQFFDLVESGVTTVEVKWDPFVDAAQAVKEMELEEMDD